MTLYSEFVSDIRDALFPEMSEWRNTWTKRWDLRIQEIERAQLEGKLTKDMINEYYLDIKELRTIQTQLTKLQILLEEL